MEGMNIWPSKSFGKT